MDIVNTTGALMVYIKLLVRDKQKQLGLVLIFLLNPMLYAEVITWLGDKLCLNRIEAGNFCKDLNRAVYSIKDVDFIKLAIALNKKIFGRHETGIRNIESKIIQC